MQCFIIHLFYLVDTIVVQETQNAYLVLLVKNVTIIKKKIKKSSFKLLFYFRLYLPFCISEVTFLS